MCDPIHYAPPANVKRSDLVSGAKASQVDNFFHWSQSMNSNTRVARSSRVRMIAYPTLNECWASAICIPRKMFPTAKMSAMRPILSWYQFQNRRTFASFLGRNTRARTCASKETMQGKKEKKNQNHKWIHTWICAHLHEHTYNELYNESKHNNTKARRPNCKKKIVRW